MFYVANQVVWAHWHGSWNPCMIIDQDRGLFIKAEVPPKSGEQDILWLGEGLVSRMSTSYASMRDFCKGFETCYPKMNPGLRFRTAAEMCVKLTASFSRIPIGSSKWDAWALQQIKSCKTLILPACFYQALKYKYSLRKLKTIAARPSENPKMPLSISKKTKKKVKKARLASENDSILSENSPASADIFAMPMYYDELLDKSFHLPDISPKIEDIEARCPIGWLAWYRSVAHKSMMPCIVLDHKRFPGYAVEDHTTFITSLVQEGGQYKKYRVMKANLLDFGACFNATYEGNKDPHYDAQIEAALQIVSRWANISESNDISTEKLLEWVNENASDFSPFILDESRLEVFYKKL